MQTNLIAGLVVLIVLVGGIFLFSNNNSEDTSMVKEDEVMVDKKDSMAEEAPTIKTDAMMKGEEGAMMEKKGSYEVYSAEKLSLAQSGDVVLFFRASWCPTCRGLDSDIRSHVGDIPDGVTILDVDYDTSTDLKKKYGVTYQHTLVQVDASGNQIIKWTGSPTLALLLENIK